MTLEERFWAKVDKSGGPDACWPWIAHRNGDGYGKFRVSSESVEGAHRVAFKLSGGVLTDEDPDALHECDNPPCCNPSHLFAGNSTINNRDRKQKGRSAVGEKAGRARLTEDQVRGIRSSGKTIRELAKIHGVHFNTVQAVKARKSWEHIP